MGLKAQISTNNRGVELRVLLAAGGASTQPALNPKSFNATPHRGGLHNKCQCSLILI